jgi:hypothetical protein
MVFFLSGAPNFYRVCISAKMIPGQNGIVKTEECGTFIRKILVQHSVLNRFTSATIRLQMCSLLMTALGRLGPNL